MVENVGVPPDVEVEQLPDEVIAGHDPQLEKAIELALQGLLDNPPHDYRKRRIRCGCGSKDSQRND